MTSKLRCTFFESWVSHRFSHDELEYLSSPSRIESEKLKINWEDNGWWQVYWTFEKEIETLLREGLYVEHRVIGSTLRQALERRLLFAIRRVCQRDLARLIAVKNAFDYNGLTVRA